MNNLISFLPNTPLINENGDNISFHDIIKNKTVVLNMFYSNCQIKCIPLGKLLSRVNLLLNQTKEKEDICFISITLDAENDGVEELNNFKSKVYNEGCFNWHFYTGKFGNIEELRYKLGMYSPEPEVDKIKSNHSGNFMIFNEKVNCVKHTQAFDNPVDIARKVLQITTRNFYNHSYDLSKLNYNMIPDDKLFENIQTMNSVFTVTFLPKDIQDKYSEYAEKQRGFQYNPLENGKKCFCKNKS